MATRGQRVSADRPLVDRLLADPAAARAVTHIERLAPRAGQTAEWPEWVPPLLRERLADRGIERLWAHQALAADLAWSGRSTVIATGTASGKSVAYLLPVLSRLLADPHARALYLSPTKALGADQLRAIRHLALPQVGAAPYDGDTPAADRDWVRHYGRLVFTNPDMLHVGLLPAHQRWAAFWRRLAFVVVDECHTYRGVFGSHVAHVLRRLRRVCARYHADPVFVLASATASDPAVSASRLLGLPVAEIVDDTAPRGGLSFALWEPPLTPLTGENGAPVRRAANAEAARLLADLVVEGARSLAFVTSRRGAETVALSAQRALAEAAPELASRVAAYRSGYLPEERRAVEAGLADRTLLGVATTNALELGVDISGLDAVILSGFPGTIASLWQQAGRAGRSGQDALAVLVARDDPLDTYLVHHPAAIFGRPVEATVLDPDNPHVLGPQLACAAVELPLTEPDLDLFGPNAGAAVEELTAQGVLRRRANGWYWTSRDRPRVDIRGAGGEQIGVVEAGTGRLLGTVDPGRAHSTVHAGAVYLHRGESYLIDELDLDEAVALAHAEEPDYSTWAREITDITIVGATSIRPAGEVTAAFGTVEVSNQVVSYLRKRPTGEVLDERPLDLPARQLRTRAVWYTVSEALLAAAGLAPADVPGAAHAAEHAAIGLLPLVATCDRWDVGGVSTALHADTGLATVFVYDGHPGGAGFAERGYAMLDVWLTATRDALRSCGCESGCPSCVQSPKCGNGNEPLDKAGAIALLDAVLQQLSR